MNGLNSVCCIRHKVMIVMFTWVSALVRFVPCVGSDVLLKMGQLSEFSLADLAPVGLDSQVDPHMLGEVGAVGKRLAALTALVRLGFPHVHLCVKLEVGFGSEHLQRENKISFECDTLEQNS